MFQLNGTQYLPLFEYLTQNVLSNTTSFPWTVQTTKDLTFSNMFFLSIFLEGHTSPESNSHYFNITGRNVDKPSSSTSTSTSTSTSASTSTTTSAASVASTSDHTASTTAYPTSAPSELSSGAKAGIGIGIAAAVALGISAGWFIFGRRKPQYLPEQGALAMRGSSYEPAQGYQESYQLSAEGPVASTAHELHSSPQQYFPQTIVSHHSRTSN